jgi:beta-carotene 3-hydroxylase
MRVSFSHASHIALEWVVGTAVVGLMELWAGLLHERVWHGPLWIVHRSHHVAREGRFERNDALSILHAPIAVALIVFGCRLPAGLLPDLAFGAGVGMTVFGGLYLLIHDGIVHERLPVGFLGKVRILRAIADAHRRHHRRAGGPPYGLLFGPWERPGPFSAMPGASSARCPGPSASHSVAPGREGRDARQPDDGPRSGVGSE